MNYRRLLFIPISFISFFSFAQQNDPNVQNYSQKIEGTNLSFTMQAIPGGTYKMGSDMGRPDETPIHDVKLDPFWMSTFEVTWDIFEMFLYKDYEITKSIEPIPSEVDAVTRPTKPYLDMTFGMGKEGHPALAMTHYNAIQFCKWLYRSEERRV